MMLILLSSPKFSKKIQKIALLEFNVEAFDIYINIILKNTHVMNEKMP